MAGNSVWEQIAFGRQKEDPSAGLAKSIADLTTYLKGDEAGVASSSPISLGRKAIRDIKKGRNQYAATEIPDLFSRYQTDIQAGRLTPAEASAAYEAAARGAGVTSGVVKKAGELAAAMPGIPSKQLYERYVPFMQQSAQDLLGRQFSRPEIENYISSMQGLGVTNPLDVASTVGKLLTTGEEYQDRQTARTYRYTPRSGMPTADTSATEAFQRMLNASIA